MNLQLRIHPYLKIYLVAFIGASTNSIYKTIRSRYLVNDENDESNTNLSIGAQLGWVDVGLEIIENA